MKYVVVKKGWEYNDSTYDQEEGYQIDSKLLDTEKEAEDEERARTIKYVRNYGYRNVTGPEHFAFNYYTDSIDESLAYFIEKIGGSCTPHTSIYSGSTYYTDVKLPSFATDEQILEALELADISFYDVVKIEE